MKITNLRYGTALGLAAVTLFGLAVLLLLAGRGATPTGSGPVPVNGGGYPAAAANPTSRADAEAGDPFAGYCVRESNVLLRAFTTAELQEFDSAVKLRGSAGWLVDGDRFAVGQGWVGDLDGATTAYLGTKLDRPDRPGDWILTERDGRPMAMSLRSVELPSGKVLWLPYNFMVAEDCVP
ncbi:MAG TPA: hypothetical protein VFV72_03130 [Candidatus Limnocylindrales bacterium]|nr:hypothetical protein [Candidatus Limnocylindrales bacterium]